MRFIILSALLFSSPLVFSMGSPAKPAGVDIGKKLPSSFEPSGSAWHPRLNRAVVVSDDGGIAMLSADGASVQSWQAEGNWEGVAVAMPATNFIFIVDEVSATIREFNIVSGRLSGRNFKLTTAATAPGVVPLSAADKDALMDGDDDTTGAEALAFIPNAAQAEGGEFYVGSQENGTLYRFRLSLSGGNQVTYLGKIKNWNYNDLSGLEYDWVSNNLWAVWDSENRIRQMKVDGTLIKEWSVPSGSSNEEGIAVNGTTLYLSEDESSGPAPVVRRYDNFK